MDRNTEPEALVRYLAETTVRVGAVAQRLPADQLTTSPEPNGWSPNEILWHIRATADVYGEHIHRILNEDQPRWRHVSPRARMKKSRYDELPFAASFAVFTRQRTALVDVLRGLAPEAWERVALVHVPYGQEREWRLTLHERVRGMANHEDVHCEQMKDVAAALEKRR